MELNKKKTKKRKIIVFTILILFLIILCIFITFILGIIRGNCFSAYHVYIDNNYYIQYHDYLYIEITDEEQLVKINEEVAGRWCNNNEVVLEEAIKFPYLEYWIPEIMFERLDYAEDGKYITTYGLSGQNKVYQRIEE